jgi:hypothetical protein
MLYIRTLHNDTFNIILMNILVGLKTNILLIWETLYIMKFVGLGHSGPFLWIPRWSWYHKLVEHLVHSGEQLFSICMFPFLIQVNSIPSYHTRYLSVEPIFYKQGPRSCVWYLKLKSWLITPALGMGRKLVLFWGSTV